MERRHVFKQAPGTGKLHRFVVDGLDFEQGEVTLPFFGAADFTGHRIAFAQIETADLRGGHINVIRAGEVVVIGTPEESETIRQDLEYPLSKHNPGGFSLSLEDFVDHLRLAEAGKAFNPQPLADLHQVGDGFVLELFDLDRFNRGHLHRWRWGRRCRPFVILGINNRIYSGNF